MEDFGEYTPPDAVSASGTPSPAMHNAYPVLYHGAAYAYSRTRSPRSLARFNRSRWAGAARVSQIVWGGDPSTSFGFDGLSSAVRNGLSMGLSGVSLWRSDIGGYFAISEPQTSPDLKRRWIEFGFASGIMRTEADGFTLNSTRTRAQIFDPDVLPVWARYAKLRTQLQPYLASAQRTYDRTGMPLMRQLALAYPSDDAPRTATTSTCSGPTCSWRPCSRPTRRAASSTCRAAGGWTSGARCPWTSAGRHGSDPRRCFREAAPRRSPHPPTRSRCSSEPAPRSHCSQPTSRP